MGGDAREIGLDETAQAPVSLDATVDDSLAHSGLAVGTADTAAGPSISATAVLAALASRTRPLFLVAAMLGLLELAYFVWRFVLSGNPPALHASFVGHAGHGAFASLDIFDGPYLTLIRMIAVATIFLVISIWASYYFRREPRIQILATVAVITALYSPSVAVLTSSEALAAPRVAAAIIYLSLPITAFTICVLFPSGRAVPRWGLFVLPVALIPFAAQTVVMFRDRGFSVGVAAACFPFALLFFGMQAYRYRRHATVRERAQIKWICYAGAAYVVIQAIAVVGIIPLLADREGAAFPFFRILFELLIAASYLVALASFLFSGARYRVWDIDRVINRTIVYAVVSVLLGGALIVAYFGLRALFASTLPPVAGIAISLAIVLGLAAPLRRRIARWIDRRFYGIGLDYEALAAKAVRAAQGALPTTGNAFASYDELVLLGRGGMGAVYRAHHADFDVPVALKVMSPHLAGDADAQARFQRESQILEDLRHRNVVPFLASGHEAGLAFIAMHYIDGEDLAALVRRRGTLTAREAAHVVADIAAALDLAHARGVVHRDVKPANVLVEGAAERSLFDRRALVMDFGVAWLADDSRAPDASLVGSLPYIAPEQIQNADEVDARADVYALGATAYELVTGQPPFVESTALGLVLAHRHRPPLDPRVHVPALPESVSRAILKALAKDPAQRHTSAGAFADDLAR